MEIINIFIKEMHEQWRVFTKNQGTEVLTLPSIMEVAEHLSSTRALQ